MYGCGCFCWDLYMWEKKHWDSLEVPTPAAQMQVPHKGFSSTKPWVRPLVCIYDLQYKMLK